MADLHSLFDPRCVVVVGASADRAKWGYWLARGALSGQDRRPVHLVNSGRPELFGRPTYASLADVPDQPDLVVVCVPPRSFEAVVGEALEQGATFIVAITAGLDRDVVARTAERVRHAGARMVGPNCMGLADASTKLSLLWGDLPRGSIGLVSQSGNLAIELGRLAAADGIGFSRFVSLGDAADLDASDVVEVVAAGDGTDVLAVYVEDFRRMRDLAVAAGRVLAGGIPVVMLAGGRGQVGAAAAKSHTGALAGDRAAVEAACRAAGITLVSTPTQLLDVAHVLSVGQRVAGPRIGIVADGGGHGVVASDLAEGLGLVVPALGASVSTRVLDHLPPTATARNPVDLAGGGENDMSSYGRVVATLLESGEVDAVVLSGYFGAYGDDEPDLESDEQAAAALMIDAAKRSGRALTVHSCAPTSALAQQLRGFGVPVTRRIEGALAGLAAAYQSRSAPGVPNIPPPLPPMGEGDPYVLGRELLDIEFPETRFVASSSSAVVAAETIGYPVVVKAMGVAHKSDIGGVALDLSDGPAVMAAYDRVTRASGRPEVSVESMAGGDGIELIVGGRNDRSAGPCVLVGRGGVGAEVDPDVAVALAPIDEKGAAALVGRLRCAPLLNSFRGLGGIDLEGLAKAIVSVSQAIATHPDLATIEVNPLLLRRAQSANQPGAPVPLALDVHITAADGVDQT